MAEQHFFLRGKWLGSRQIDTVSDLSSGLKIANSYALFCPACADIWGRVMHEHKDSYCQATNSACIAHASFWSDATFTKATNIHKDARQWSDDLPTAVKQYEILALTTFWINHPDQRWMTKHLT